MCCEGEKTEMASMLTPEQLALQKQMIGLVSGNIGKGVKPYPGAVTSAVDPLKLMAANIMMNYGQGRGYTAPPMMGVGGMPGIGGGGTGGAGTMPTNDSRFYRDWSPRRTPMVETGESQGMAADRGYPRGPGWNTDMGMPNRQSIWPTGYDPLNDPYGWNRWLY